MVKRADAGMFQWSRCIGQPDAGLLFNFADTGDRDACLSGSIKDLFPFFRRSGEAEFIIISTTQSALQAPDLVLLLKDVADRDGIGIEGGAGMGRIQDMGEVA